MEEDADWVSKERQGEGACQAASWLPINSRKVEYRYLGTWRLFRDFSTAIPSSQVSDTHLTARMDTNTSPKQQGPEDIDTSNNQSIVPLFDAATASFLSSASTSDGGSNRRYPYKVFLSFRGEDIGHNFVSHLHKELTRKGIHTFKDDHNLKRGDSLSPSLLEAISGSRVAVVVLSKHYASSTRCLKELVEIMERNGQLVVIPIFYKVDPSNVKNQKGTFGEDLKMLGKKRKRENDSEAEMNKWRNALSQVATIAGWDSRDRDEATFIEYVVRDISDKLICAASHDTCDLVAIDSQIVEIDKLLEVETDVHMLGIWGMGGIGKTTLAKVLYNRMSSQYQAFCFLGNVKDKFEKSGATGLRKELLSKVLVARDLDTWSLDEDSSMIKDRLCSKKVFIVLMMWMI